MTAYTKVFLVVRRQVKSISTAVSGPVRSNTIFGSSVRSAKNLFVMCVAYWLTFLPVTFSAMVRASGSALPDAVQFAMSWIYVSSSAFNGFLYVSLHSCVRRELRRYLPRCRRLPIVSASPRAVFDGGGESTRQGFGDNGAAARGIPGAPVDKMTPSRRLASNVNCPVTT